MRLTNLKGKKVIVITGRVHPGETASSHAVKGLIEGLLEPGDSPAINFLRNHFFFIFVPMLNPDGVSVGNSRCSFSGNDLNETWLNPDRFIHPEIYYTKKLMTKLKKENEIIFFADFQASFERPAVFVLGNNHPANPKAVREFPRYLENRLNHFEYRQCKYLFLNLVLLPIKKRTRRVLTQLSSHSSASTIPSQSK